MARVNVLLAELSLVSFSASLTVIVTENVPIEFVVPLISPVVREIDRPEGSPEATHVRGGIPPVADILNEYSTPDTPSSNALVVIRSEPPCAYRASRGATTITILISQVRHIPNLMGWNAPLAIIAPHRQVGSN
jgi:hypothetical protein